MHTEVVRQRLKITQAKWEDNIETDVKEVRRYSVDWIHMAQNMTHWRVLMNVGPNKRRVI